jgi:O-antigen ligase
MSAARLRLPELGWPALVTGVGASLGLLAAQRPAFAVAAAVGLAFVALMAVDLTVGLCVFTFVSFIDVVPGGPAFSLTKVIGLLLALSWLATIATRDDVKRDFFGEHPGALYLLALFVAWAGVSELWAHNQGAALTAASRYGLNFLLFPIVYTALRERRHVVWLAWTFVIGALVSAAFGVVSPQPTDEGRLTGAIGEANELASVLVAAFVISCALAIANRRSPGARTAALAAAAICAAGVFFSLSRGGLLAFGLVLVTGVFVAGRWRGRAAIVALVAALCTLTYFAAFAAPDARDRITHFGGGAGRVDLWRIGWRMVEDKPVQGVGAGNFQSASPRYLVRPGALVRDDFVLDRPKQTHNIYLQVLSELGVPGLALFLAIIFFSLSCGVRGARSFGGQGDAAMEVLCWGVTVAALGVLAADFFQSEQFSKQLWLLLALGPALLALASRRAEA